MTKTFEEMAVQTVELALERLKKAAEEKQPVDTYRVLGALKDRCSDLRALASRVGRPVE